MGLETKGSPGSTTRMRLLLVRPLLVRLGPLARLEVQVRLLLRLRLLARTRKLHMPVRLVVPQRQLKPVRKAALERRRPVQQVCLKMLRVSRPLAMMVARLAGLAQRQVVQVARASPCEQTKA